MLTVLVPLLIVLAAPIPAPSPVAPPSPLKEIGHVESASICSAIVVHANSAISAALENDQDLALIINRLRTTDLDDDNPIKRRNGMNDLSTLAGRIRLSALSGTSEIKRLRTMAAQTTDANRKVELKAFADALGGAIARQRKAAVDLDAMLTIIDGRRAVEELNTSDEVQERTAITDPGRSSQLASDSGELRNPAAPVSPSRVDDILRNVADDFAARSLSILGDEGSAADHSLSATTGC